MRSSSAGQPEKLEQPLRAGSTMPQPQEPTDLPPTSQASISSYQLNHTLKIILGRQNTDSKTVIECFIFKGISNRGKAGIGPQIRRKGEHPPSSAAKFALWWDYLPHQPKPHMPPALNHQTSPAQSKPASISTNLAQLSSNVAQPPSAAEAQEYGALGELSA